MMRKPGELKKPLQAGALRKNQPKRGLPSSADLDRIAEEQRIAEARKGLQDH